MSKSRNLAFPPLKLTISTGSNPQFLPATLVVPRGPHPGAHRLGSAKRPGFSQQQHGLILPYFWRIFCPFFFQRKGPFPMFNGCLVIWSTKLWGFRYKYEKNMAATKTLGISRKFTEIGSLSMELGIWPNKMDENWRNVDWTGLDHPCLGG